MIPILAHEGAVLFIKSTSCIYPFADLALRLALWDATCCSQLPLCLCSPASDHTPPTWWAQGSYNRTCAGSWRFYVVESAFTLRNTKSGVLHLILHMLEDETFAAFCRVRIPWFFEAFFSLLWHNALLAAIGQCPSASSLFPGSCRWLDRISSLTSKFVDMWCLHVRSEQCVWDVICLV